MTRLLTGLLIVLLVISAFGLSESVAADGKVFKPQGRCVTVSNGRHRVRINCGRPKTNIEFGRFDFGVSIAEGVRSATARNDSQPSSTSESQPETATRNSQEPERANRDCHPAYGGCIPTDQGDINCEDIDFAEVQLVNVNEDPYGLDELNDPGNGITCDGIGQRS